MSSLALLIYRLGNRLNSTNSSWAEPMQSSEPSTGNPNVDEGRASGKRSKRVGKGSEWGQETLSSVASFMRHTLAGAFEYQTQRGVLELQRDECHRRCTQC